ncbi:MAG: hypothetical protein ACRDTF_07460 [Pseudonocardiaceae bacterium]
MVAGTVALAATTVLVVVLGVIADATSILDRTGWAGFTSIAVAVFGVSWLAGQLRVRSADRSARQVTSAVIILVVGMVGVVQYGRPLVAPKSPETAMMPSPVPTPASSAGLNPQPIAVAVEALDLVCGSTWFTPQQPSQILVPQPADGNNPPGRWRQWPQLANGAAADNSEVLLTVQGTASSSVTLTRMTVEVIDRRPPMTGTTLWRRCGGPDTLRWVDINLDENQPRVTSRDLDSYALQVAQENGWRVEPVQFPYEVADHDSETFAVNAHTENCDCTWIIKFYWAASGATGEVTVTNNGTPFRTTSSKNAEHCWVMNRDDPLDCS